MILASYENILFANLRKPENIEMKRAWKNNRAINEITHMKKAGHKNLWNVPNIAITENLIPGNRLFYFGESLDTFMPHVVK